MPSAPHLVSRRGSQPQDEDVESELSSSEEDDEEEEEARDHFDDFIQPPQVCQSTISQQRLLVCVYVFLHVHL